METLTPHTPSLAHNLSPREYRAAFDLRSTCGCTVCKGRPNTEGQWMRFESTGADGLEELGASEAHWVKTGRHL